MKPTVPNPAPGRPVACDIPWCWDNHSPAPDCVHSALIADLRMERATVEVIYWQRQTAGALQPPMLRVMYGPDWAVNEALDIPLHAAGPLSDILALLTVQTYAEFGAALKRGAEGPTARKAVKW